MPSDSPEVLRFYFDFISNNAYIAWTQLPKLEETYGIDIVPVPVLFAGLLEANGQLGPAEVPPKLRWMGRNVMRKAAILGVPLNPPAHHPYNPLPSLRICCVDQPEHDRRRLIDGLFQAVWVERQHIAEPDVVAGVATAAGLDGSSLIEKTQLPEVKEKLRSNTDEAIREGVFGVPTMIVHDELFFGYDDFPYMDRVLQGDDPLTAETLDKWHSANVTPSSVRRRK